jgi:hypothetical protein
MKLISILKILLLLALILLFSTTVLSQEIDSKGTESGAVKIYGVPVALERLSESNSVTEPSSKVGDVFEQMPPSDKFTAGNKMKYGLKKAFFNAGTFVFPAISAVRQQMDENKPNKDIEDEIADGFSRYARNYATASSKALLASGVYPIIFKQDPRYEPSHKHGFKSRVLYAASRVFVTRGDNGKLQVNSSHLAGGMTASALANIWERNSPGHDRIGVGPTFRRFGNMLIFDVIRFVVLKEFGSDIRKFMP